MQPWQQEGQKLEVSIRPETFPLAIKIFPSGEPLPAKVKKPARDLGVQVALCQAVGMARRYGWTLAIDQEDQSCPIAHIAFGFQPSLPFYEEGHLACGMYVQNKEAAVRSEAIIPKLTEQERGTVVMAPLTKANFEPDLLLLYGNSAQIMRLVAASLYFEGGAMETHISPRADCAHSIIGTLQEEKAKVILPCYGDRIFGQTQDHEMAFTLPYKELKQLLIGLEGTHRGGIRYPVPTYLRYQVHYPPNYEKLKKMWEEKEEA
ncbi:DUF169 domain-containing protein [Heliorestis convoluta]|uniref:DUF169 domain-containing protein n=1 Tax=Heliorestis convoluta TaxID=356322 RepID=A0A5Q2N1H3_9FIRM|nr:DUF169 domain-containing protein [Heliorestis convoluta]QGG47436.1 hypothetical protein FTV88_1289 [Heliorestis convoluta]